MNDLACKPNFNLLLSRDVNSPRLCYVKNEVDSVMPYLTNFDLLLSRDVNSPRPY